MIYLSSFVIQTHHTLSLWPLNIFTQNLSIKFHILIVLSSLPDIIYLLSDVIQIEYTQSLWPYKVLKYFPDCKFQIAISPSPPLVIIYLSSDVRQIVITVFSLSIVLIKSPV